MEFTDVVFRAEVNGQEPPGVEKSLNGYAFKAPVPHEELNYQYNKFGNNFASLRPLARNKILGNTTQVTNKVADLAIDTINTLVAGDKLGILNGIHILPANNTVSADISIVCESSSAVIEIPAGRILTFSGEVEGKLNLTGPGTLKLTGNCPKLEVFHNGTVIDDAQATGTIIENGQFRSKQSIIIQKQQQNAGKSLFFNGDDQQVLIPNNSNLNVGTENFTIKLVFRTNKDYTSGIGTLLQKGDASIFLLSSIDTSNQLSFSLLESGGSVQTITSNQAVNDGLIHVVFLRAKKGGSMSIILDGVQQTLTLPRPATTFTTSETLYLAANNLADEFTGELFQVEIYNRLLSMEECLFKTDLNRQIDYADSQANQTVLTSGLLEVGKRYRISLFATGDDFLNIGATANETGAEFVATGTTPTTWSNTSELIRIGRIAGFLPENIDWKTSTWFDSENDNHGTITGAKTVNSNPRIEITDQYDHVVTTTGHQSQIANSSKILRIDEAAQNFKKQDGSILTPSEGARILLAGRDTPTNDIVLPAVNKLRIHTERAFVVPMSGTNIIVPGNHNIIEMWLDEDYKTRAALATEEAKRVIKNRGQKNRIRINGEDYFTGKPHQAWFVTRQENPYYLPEEPDWYDGYPDVSNENLCLFRDLWDEWGGDPVLQMGPIYNPKGAIASTWIKVAMIGEAGRFIRQAPISGGTVDPDMHLRETPGEIGSAQILSGNYTTTATNEISGIDQTDILICSPGSRVFDEGLGILGPNTGILKTTIVSNIVKNDTNNFSIFLIDSETRLPIASTAATSGNLTVDMGGNTGVSVQESAMWRHWHISAALANAKQSGINTADFGRTGPGSPFFETGYIGAGSAIAEDGYDDPNLASESRPTNKSQYSYIKQ